MKGKIKKSIIVIMIIAIASFIFTAAVSAGGDRIKHGIQGTYAVAGGGTGLLALFGFDENQMPVISPTVPGAYWILSVVVEGILTLNRDGTGTKNDTVIVQTQPNHLLPQIPAFDPLMTQPWIGGADNRCKHLIHSDQGWNHHNLHRRSDLWRVEIRTA